MHTEGRLSRQTLPIRVGERCASANRPRVGPTHQLPRNASSVSGLSILPAGHTGTPCASTLRQQVLGVIHKSPGRPRFEATLHAGEQPSCVGSEQSALTEGGACAEQCLFRGMDALPARGSNNLGSLWQSSSRPLRHRRQLSLPNLFYKEHGCPGPRKAQPSTLCFPHSRSATAGTQASQGTTSQTYSNSPVLEEPIVGVWVIPAAESSPVADHLETGPPLSSKRHEMASMARVMGPACVAARREPFVLPEPVLDTMAEARAQSTRRLYALKWSISSAWCQDRDLDPVTSNVSVVLSFLQEMLDKQHFLSTIKVYMPAIAAFHAPIVGRSVGRDSAVIQFYEALGEWIPRVLVQFHLGWNPKGGPIWAIVIFEPQSTLIENRPAVSTGIGQANRRPAGPFRQPCLPGIRA